MAGIGWKLERMLEEGTLASTIQAYLTGVAVTSAPWLLTTSVLVSMRVLARGDSAIELARIEVLITLAYAVTLVLSAPVHVVVSRYAADRLYEGQLQLVADPLRRAFTATIVGFLGLGIAVMFIAGAPVTLAVPGAVLTAIIAAQWLLLAVGGGMSAPAGVLRAFAIGALISVLAAIALERAAGLGARGYLFGFTFGQSIALLLMLVRVLRDLPAREERAPPGALRGAFREYRLLAASALFVHAAVWIDKLLAWVLAGPAAARAFASVSSLAWFAVIPAFAWIYIRVETAFYRVFRGYFGGIQAGASLDELEAKARALRAETGRLVRGALVLQIAVLVLAQLAAPHVIAVLGMPEQATLGLRLTLIGASLQVLTLLALLLLYYLDMRREAYVIAICQLVAIAGGTTVAIFIGVPAALGSTLGASIPALLAVWTLRRVVSSLVPHTFQSQPFGASH
ncbi:MAG TPA: exopolysaccharide Pel transporter PelG [Kofleriaceae bacterium]